MKDELGNCNDFVDSDFTSSDGIILSLKEAVEYQREKNKSIMVYEYTDPNLVIYFRSLGGKVFLGIDK
jgi:hypothetical protein